MSLQNSGEPKSLNVKDPEANRLAAAIARATGRTITAVVTDALQQSYDRLDKRRIKAPVEELLLIARRCASKVKSPYVDHAAFLYDEQGLPK